MRSKNDFLTKLILSEYTMLYFNILYFFLLLFFYKRLSCRNTGRNFRVTIKSSMQMLYFDKMSYNLIMSILWHLFFWKMKFVNNSNVILLSYLCVAVVSDTYQSPSPHDKPRDVVNQNAPLKVKERNKRAFLCVAILRFGILIALLTDPDFRLM